MATNEIDGTYVSEDGEFTLVISDSDYNTGKYNGTFTSKSSPVGEDPLVYGPFVGSYDFTNGRWPCVIGFGAIIREEPDWSYCVSDYWTGGMDQNGPILMSGSRAHCNLTTTTVFSFEQVVFNKISD